MKKAYIGIDPGSKGAMALLDPERPQEPQFWSLTDTEAAQISEAMGQIKSAYPDCVAVIEDVHAVFGSSAKGTFSFGYIKGLLVGLLLAHQIPYTMVPPKTWQKSVWTFPDKVERGKKTDNKATSLNCGRRLFPMVDFRRTPSCKKPDDNLCDALLMAEYARRSNF